MSDTTDNTDSAPRSATLALRAEVKQAVESRSTRLRDRVIEELAQAEEDRRAKILHAALETQAKLSAERSKIKPSLVVDVDQETGKEVKKYSKADIESRKKLSEKLSKLDKLVEAAFNDGTTEAYVKLAEFKG